MASFFQISEPTVNLRSGFTVAPLLTNPQILAPERRHVLDMAWSVGVRMFWLPGPQTWRSQADD